MSGLLDHEVMKDLFPQLNSSAVYSRQICHLRFGSHHVIIMPSPLGKGKSDGTSHTGRPHPNARRLDRFSVLLHAQLLHEPESSLDTK